LFGVHLSGLSFACFDSPANQLVFEENLMANPKLTIALSHYDRHVPFFDGTRRNLTASISIS
jgi:hypothetical protein